MKNNKGQALVEFIIIMPIFLLILITIIDYSNIIFKKYALERDLDTISDMYKDNKLSMISSYANDKNIVLKYEESGNLTIINASTSVNVNSPILSRVLGNPYSIQTDKTIYNSSSEG